MTPRTIGNARLAAQALTLAEKAALKRAAAEAYYNQVRQTPMTWDFGQIEALDDDGVSAGAAGVQTLQMRDDPYNGQDDLKNWLSVGAGAITALLGSAPTTLQPLKTTANVWVQTTAAQALTVLVTGDGVQLSALQRGYVMLQTFGAIKKAIADALEAEDEQALDAIDVTAGYPA
ncbi:hypothetical protein [Phenylobacterium sp.]|uniref:hypothetical protein n=1 Tax=Phenylobacterium sp. TaxID=1871053 RepID=UPI00393938FB